MAESVSDSDRAGVSVKRPPLTVQSTRLVRSSRHLVEENKLAIAPSASELVLALSGCAATIGPSSFFSQASTPPQTRLAAPTGYSLDAAMLTLPGLGRVHAVRLDNPASGATLIYAGGNMSFVSGQSQTATALARATNADIILYDYPGRGGTNVPTTIRPGGRWAERDVAFR